MSGNEKTRKGFSLLEVLIAMAILVIGVLAVLGTFPSLLDLSQKSWGTITATTLAEDKMQACLSGVYGLPLSTSCSGNVDHPGPNYHANYHAIQNAMRTWCGQPAPPDQNGGSQSNLQWVWVQVTWTENGQLHSVKLDDYLSY